MSSINPLGLFPKTVGNTINKDLQGNKKTNYQKYLGCNIETIKNHMENQFKKVISLEKHGLQQHINIKIPIMYQKMIT